MPRPSHPIGSRFGRLTLVGRPGPNKWLVRCDCGVSKVVDGGNVVSGKTKSCGCLQAEVARINGRVTKTHGLTRSNTYSSWVSMKQRCLTPTHPAYPKYGGKGIGVCERWAASFSDFLADMGPRPPGTSLDRFPNGDGNYEPCNCRWATAAEQNNNRRTVPFYEMDGRRLTLPQWAELTGVPATRLRARIRGGMSISQAICTPVDEHQQRRSLGRAKTAAADRARNPSYLRQVAVNKALEQA